MEKRKFTKKEHEMILKGLVLYEEENFAHENMRWQRIINNLISEFE